MVHHREYPNLGRIKSQGKPTNIPKNINIAIPTRSHG
jgi:hypothetical protein